LHLVGSSILLYLYDILLFILIKTDIVLDRINPRVCYVLFTVATTLCQVMANKASNLWLLVPVVFTAK